MSPPVPIRARTSQLASIAQSLGKERLRTCVGGRRWPISRGSAAADWAAASTPQCPSNTQNSAHWERGWWAIVSGSNANG
eukprot:6178529-Pyramimonas_sp.AAC.2